MAYVLIVAGILVVFVSFVGCLGAVKEVRCMMLTYFITLFLMFVVLVIGGVLGYVFRDQVYYYRKPLKKLLIMKCSECNFVNYVRMNFNVGCTTVTAFKIGNIV